MLDLLKKHLSHKSDQICFLMEGTNNTITDFFPPVVTDFSCLDASYSKSVSFVFKPSGAKDDFCAIEPYCAKDEFYCF